MSKDSMKDTYCFSPAYAENYDYKKGIVKEFHIGGVSSMKEPMEGQYASKKASQAARMEQDEAMTNPRY